MSVFTYNGDVDTVMTPIDSIRYYKQFLRAGFMSMDAHTGQVKAYVGGIDFAHFQYDMVMGGRRQVGSTIKPFLYSLAMENGASPCDKVANVQRTYMVAGRPWTPRNSNQPLWTDGDAQMGTGTVEQLDLGLSDVEAQPTAVCRHAA
jgi:penicillin-binding protein 1A